MGTHIPSLLDKLASVQWHIQAVRNTAGLSYRQIKHWDDKGHINNPRSSKKQWRVFTAKDIFGLQICAYLKKLGIPPIKARWILKQIKEGDFLEQALYKYFKGTKVYLYSDLYKFIHIGGENSISDIKPSLERSPVIALLITPLIDIFWEAFKLPAVSIRPSLKSLELTKKEVELINGVRDPKYGQIKIKKTNSGLKIKGTKFLDKNALDKIVEQISKGKGCKITTHRDANNKTTSAQIEEDLG